MKGKTGEKCTKKKKKKVGTEKIGVWKKNFGQSESERLFHRAICYLRVGFFFNLHLPFKLGRLQFGESGENP